MRDIAEQIVCSATWYKDLPLVRPEVLVESKANPIGVDRGIVFCGLRHHHCLLYKAAVTGLRDCEAGEFEQGFLTNKNRFVGRVEAGEIAYKTGQINEPVVKLHSEDLY